MTEGDDRAEDDRGASDQEDSEAGLVDHTEKEDQKANKRGAGDEGEQGLFQAIEANAEATEEDQAGGGRHADGEPGAGENGQEPLQALRV